jgi:putative ABC transport system permease protein
MEWTAPAAATIAAVALLVGVTVAGLRIFGVPRPLAPLLAILRGAIQLALLSAVLAGIIRDPVWVGLGLTVMFAAAVFTASRRIRASLRQATAVGLAMLAGNLVVLGVVFATGALEFSPRYVLAIGGIIVGNTMTTASLTGRAFHSSVHDHWDEVEGWLALGATPIESTRELARSAVYSAMVPAIDQTKTTGIVVLPGAFVGAIFGGASPLEAGRFQIVVLAGILAAGTLTAIIMLRLIGAVAVRPTPESFARTARPRFARRR